MLDLDAQLARVVDDVPAISLAEVRTRVRRRRRRRTAVAGASVVVLAVVSGAVAASWRDDGDGRVAAAPTISTPVVGEVLGTLSIPAIEFRGEVIEGIEREHLKRGPGHDPASALPGEEGTVVIVGHRTTYGGPFNRLDELRRGDLISLVMRDGRTFRYELKTSLVVTPDMLVPAIPADLALVTFHPEFAATQRLVAFADTVPHPVRGRNSSNSQSGAKPWRTVFSLIARGSTNWRR